MRANLAYHPARHLHKSNNEVNDPVKRYQLLKTDRRSRGCDLACETLFCSVLLFNYSLPTPAGNRLVLIYNAGCTKKANRVRERERERERGERNTKRYRKLKCRHKQESLKAELLCVPAEEACHIWEENSHVVVKRMPRTVSCQELESTEK